MSSEEKLEFIIKLYKIESFFYPLLNNGIRKFLPDPEQIAYFRKPFADLFNAIKQVYQQKQSNWELRRNKLTVYRGAYYSESEMAELKENIGNYMEIEGFMSTSIKKAPCWPFISNTFVEIEIPEREIDELNDNYNKGEGFCFLDDQNKTYAKKQEDLEKSTEMECLFNPLNIFQIVEVEEDKEVKNEVDQALNVFYIKLKYIVPDLESETNPVSDELKKHF